MYKKMKQIYLLFSILCMGLYSMPSGAQSTFKQGLTRGNPDLSITCTGVVECKDTNIYVTGYQYNNNTYKSIAFVAALNSNGKLLWSKQYVSNGGIEFNEIWEAPDGNLIVGIATPKIVFGGQNFGSGFAKINKNDGSIMWSSYLDSNSETQAKGLIIKNNTNDGFTMTGMKIKATGVQVQKYNYCIRTDVNGQRLTGPTNNRYFEPTTTSLDFTKSMLDKDDNCYSIASFGNTSFRIVKTPNNGTQPEWLKAYSLTGLNGISFYDMLDIGGGKLLVIGTGNDVGSNPNTFEEGYRGIVILMNSNGEIEWSKQYKVLNQGTFFYRTIPTSDGFLLIDIYGLVVALNNDGTVKWAYNYYKDPPVYSFLLEIAPALDGGYIAAGEIWNDAASTSYGAIIKMDKDGLVAGCCNEPAEVTITPLQISMVDQPFAITNDTIKNVGWPETVTNINLLNEPLCAPVSYKLQDSTICAGGCLVIKLPKLPNGTTSTWSGSDQVTIEPFVGTDSVRICFNEVGTQPIQLQLKLSDGCIPPPYNNDILVKEASAPLVFALSDSLFCPGGCTEILIENSATATFDFPGGVQTQDAPPKICYQKEGKYPLKARQIQGGCLRTNAIEVNVQNLIDEVPNAFTPNNDQINDVFKPLLDCPPTDYLFRIFDRWGNALFETTDYEAAWDGTFNNQPAPMDVYIWTVNSSNLQVSYKGDVTLIR
jgi:gliding motility-associated-like protein